MTDMYYGASASIFKNALELRNNMTAAEKKMWLVLSNKKMKGYRFKSQHPIGSFIADFYCHKAKLVIEIDGDIHLDPEQADYDIGRTHDLKSFGLRVIRFSNEQIQHDMDFVIQEIEELLRNY